MGVLEAIGRARGSPLAASRRLRVPPAALRQGQRPAAFFAFGHHWGADGVWRRLPLTRQMVLPVSSAMRTAPWVSTATPTGRPSRHATSVALEKVGQNIDRVAGGPPVPEWHDYLVAAVFASVPRTVLADEHAVPKGCRQRGAGVVGEAERCRVGAKCIVGRDCRRHQVGPCRFDALVDVLAPVAIGPAVKAASLTDVR